jgi:hypothetical protein
MQPPSPDPEDRTGQPPPSGLLPQGSYPAGEEGYYQRMLQSGTSFPPYNPTPTDSKKKPASPKNPMRIIVPILLALVLIMGAVIALLITTRPSGNAPNLVQLSTATQAAPTSAPPTQAAVPTPTEAVQTATPTLASDTPTAPPSTSGNYSAPQPGPGCDTNGGKWTSQGLLNINCGTTVTNAGGSWGYLYFQLPDNQAFLSNNEISVSGNDLYNQNDCLGLAEQGSSTGYLVAYCGNGQWYIYSISNEGAIVKTLNSGLTSTRSAEQLSLMLNNTTLSFGLDTETYTSTVSSLQPIKVSIGFYSPADDEDGFSIQNFSYIVPATS